MKSFSEFGLPPELSSVLNELGLLVPTPVQKEAIPLALAGRDVLATAQTGTGKTLAFAVPLISRMLREATKPALIVAPTRELAEQIGGVLVQLTAKTRLKVSVIIGGLAYQRQIASLRAQPAFVVGTPGRLLDMIRMKHFRPGEFGALVIDEADRLLDMGFEPQMNAIVGLLPTTRQSLLFSATLPDSIVRLANTYLRTPARVTIGSVSKPVERIKQDIVKTTAQKKDQTLIREIDKIAGSLIVFTRTKSRTEKVAKLLSNAGHDVVRIHGDRSQTQRSSAIAEFRGGSARILVATDIAARGIDIPAIRHVFNYDLPMCPEDYVHRIGRTARGLGAEGHALAFVTPEEEHLWAKIHKLIYGHFPVGSRQDRSGTGQPAFGRKNQSGGGGGKRGFNRSKSGSAGRPARAHKVQGKEIASPFGQRRESRSEVRSDASARQDARASASARPVPRASASARPSRKDSRPAPVAGQRAERRPGAVPATRSASSRATARPARSPHKPPDRRSRPSGQGPTSRR